MSASSDPLNKGGLDPVQLEIDLQRFDAAPEDEGEHIAITPQLAHPISRVATKNDLVLFVARSSGGQRKLADTRLSKSLDLTRKDFEQAYGEIPGDVEYLTFVMSSNDRIRPSGEVALKIASLFGKLSAVGKLIVVVNGWDGLTTNEHSLSLLFKENARKCALFVLADALPQDPSSRKFFRVNVDELCLIIDGEINIENDPEHVTELSAEYNVVQDAQLEHSTALFVRSIRRIFLDKQRLSMYNRSLQQKTYHRNVNPAERDLGKYPCHGICGDENCERRYPTTKELNAHLHHRKKENLECTLLCGKIFATKYHRNRHEQENCKNRPQNDSVSLKRKRASRTETQIPTSFTSDGGFLDYNGVIADRDLILKLPTVITDNATLQSLNKSQDIIYRDELVCRWAGCTNRSHLYSRPMKLRDHYRINHQYEYQASTHGRPDPFVKEQHDAGLRYLALVAQGVQAGEKPWPIVK
ncbi:hypothetical protein PENSTE_c016G00097 [Penicillium steckii]|uniref:C2H2-type domain-containing protein n=1 Tax=Penicillium steckii TaxID=303698 RepID=A0A1V6SYH0_9EURO|nr:hypothetical protein PENSTE_c016G00097 [Penicillium steckii]